MNDYLFHGGCLCGAVRYEGTGKSLKVVNCHCSMCRRHSGAAFLTYAAYPKKNICFSKGHPTSYRSSKDAVRGHCGNCGSPLTFVFDIDPDTIWLAGGSFDFPNIIKPTEHWYVANKLTWLTLDDGLPQWPSVPG